MAAIQQAFSMTDVHQQVLQRVIRDLTLAITKGGVDSEGNSVLGPLKYFTEGKLNLQAYYEEYRTVGESAGEQDAEVALIMWSQGFTPEDALLRARVEREQRSLHTDQTADTPDPDYEVQFFGGTDGQSHNQQVPQSPQANG
jgi:hypothetical protein